MDGISLNNVMVCGRDSTCTYCLNPATEVDHPVPRCLFPTPPPPNLVTVPTCKDCNRRKGANDTFLRDFLTCDLEGYDHPHAKDLFEGKVTRSIGRNRSELAKIVRQRPKKPLLVRTPSGLIIGEAVEVILPDDRISSIIFSNSSRSLF